MEGDKNTPVPILETESEGYCWYFRYVFTLSKHGTSKVMKFNVCS